jgi:hypothetical protein
MHKGSRGFGNKQVAISRDMGVVGIVSVASGNTRKDEKKERVVADLVDNG